MHILYLAHTRLPSPEANSVQILQMAAALGRQGHEVRIVAPWHAERARGAAGLCGVRQRFGVTGPFRLSYLPFVAVGSRLRGSYLVLAALAAGVRRPDLAYTRSLRIAALTARLGLRTVLELHMPPGSERERAVVGGLIGNDRVRWVFISDRLRQMYRRDWPVPEKRTLVAHDAVDLGRFATATSPGEARARLGLPEPLVVYAGHLYAGRGGEIVVEAAAALPQVSFLFVGGNPGDVARVAGWAKDLPNVRFLGHRPAADVPAYLHAADVLVIPHTSRSLASDGRTAIGEYASPMKLFEYMAARRPIVATRLPSVSEILRHDENALLIPPDDARALGEAIAALLADPARAARLAARAAEDVSLHTWDRRAARVLEGLS